jgi:hypothetical protein
MGQLTSQNHIGLQDTLQGYALQKTHAWWFVNGFILGPPSAGISIERKVERKVRSASATGTEILSDV